MSFNKKKLKIFFSAALLVLLPAKSLAFCPVCTAGVVAGVGFSRWLGIDDTITSIWLGALMLTFVVLTERWFDKMKIKFFGRWFLNALAYYGLTIFALFRWDVTGHPHNKILGVDKIIFGMVVGTIAFYLGYLLHVYLKKKHNGKSYFPFQKVVLPIAPLVILSVIFYFLTK